MSIATSPSAGARYLPSELPPPLAYTNPSQGPHLVLNPTTLDSLDQFFDVTLSPGSQAWNEVRKFSDMLRANSTCVKEYTDGHGNTNWGLVPNMLQDPRHPTWRALSASTDRDDDIWRRARMLRDGGFESINQLYIPARVVDESTIPSRPPRLTRPEQFQQAAKSYYGHLPRAQRSDTSTSTFVPGSGAITQASTAGSTVRPYQGSSGHGSVRQTPPHCNECSSFAGMFVPCSVDQSWRTPGSVVTAVY